MLVLYLYIEEYDWEVYLFFKVKEFNGKEIKKRLTKLDFKKYIINEILDSLGIANNGFCYSDFEKKRSIIIVNETTNKGEFINSVMHEINHLCSHIEEKYEIDPYGEEASYLIGDVAQMIYYNCAHIQ